MPTMHLVGLAAFVLVFVAVNAGQFVAVRESDLRVRARVRLGDCDLVEPATDYGPQVRANHSGGQPVERVNRSVRAKGMS